MSEQLQIQYPAYAQPVPLDPSEQVDRATFPHWLQPPQMGRSIEYRHLFESLFFVGEPSDFVVTEVPDYGWFRPADAPVLPEDRRHELGTQAFVNAPSLHVDRSGFPHWVQEPQQVNAVEYRHLIESLTFVEQSIITPPVVAPPLSWFEPASEPVLPVEYRHLLESNFDPANWEEIISTDSGVDFPSWLQPIDQPVLPVEYRYMLPSNFVQIDPDDFETETFTTATFTLRATLQDLRSAILATGYVADCSIGQPQQAQAGVFAAIWPETTSVPEVSLGTTHDYFTVKARFYTDAFADRDFETELARAVSSSWVNWLADFDVGATIRHIDVAGVYGQALTCEWGHETIAGMVCRVADVTIPLVIDDIGTLTQ